MENQLKQGDLVVLKSGGPTMTVKHKMANGTWECTWFDKNQEMKFGYFTIPQLEPAKIKD